MLDVFFGGSLAEAVATHLGESTADLDDAQLKRLAGLIREARRTRQNQRARS